MSYHFLKAYYQYINYKEEHVLDHYSFTFPSTLMTTVQFLFSGVPAIVKNRDMDGYLPLWNQTYSEIMGPNIETVLKKKKSKRLVLAIVIILPQKHINYKVIKITFISKLKIKHFICNKWSLQFMKLYNQLACCLLAPLKV